MIQNIMMHSPALGLILEVMSILNALVLKKIKVEPGSKKDFVVSLFFDISVLTSIVFPILAFSIFMYLSTGNKRFNIISIFICVLYMFFLAVEFVTVRELNLRNRKRSKFETRKNEKRSAADVKKANITEKKTPVEEKKIIPFPDSDYIDSVVAEVHAAYKADTKPRKTRSSNVNKGIFTIEV